MEHSSNSMTLRGELSSLPQFSHENHGRRFWRFLLEVKRLSGAIDLLSQKVEERGGFEAKVFLKWVEE